jgi:ATP-dependent exoDNAse (exonuclease V) beta subunit
MSSVPSKTKLFQFPEVAVVEASAGSGKTYTLAKRYLQLLLSRELHNESIPIRNILALTFTNKAAFEMKSRILEFLKALALEAMPGVQKDNILKPLNTNDKSASVKSYRIMEDLIHNYNFFQVQTIDKFINALLSGCAFKIGLTANFRIKTNSRDYLEYSLAQLIDRAPHDKETMNLFRTFLNNYLYLENRSGWFPKQDMLEIIYTLFAEHNHYGKDFLKSNITLEDLMKRKKNILQQLRLLHENLPEGTDQRFVKSLDQFLKNHVKGFDVDSLSDYLARVEIPVKKGVDVSGEVHELWQTINSGIHHLCEEEAVALFNPYISIFEQVWEGFIAKSAKDDVLFLEELNKKAGLLFDEDRVTVEELYYRLATRFHHYLLDEFQDTSRLQWRNIEEMAREALSTGGSLFYVGDRKQAIYGFRGGDVSLFDELKDKFSDYNVHVDVLTTNWRSQKAIVDFNNAVFHSENLKRFIDEKESLEQAKSSKGTVVFSKDDRAEIERIYSKAHQVCLEHHHEGYVSAEFIDAERKEERDEIIRAKLIALVSDLKHRFAYKDIAVLSRGNFELEQMTNWLLEEGIPVESERTSNIKENPLMEELVSFLKFLDSPIDNIAFADFIIGDIFTSACRLSKEEMHEFIFSQRTRLKNEKDFYLYTAFREKFPQLWQSRIEEFFHHVGLYPLYEMLVSFYDCYKCLENFPQSQGFFMHFLELIKTNEEEHADINSFLTYFDELLGEDLYVNVTNHDTIRMLTIHKAKGLEFPVVILPFLGMDVQVGKSNSNHQQSYILRKEDDGVRLLRLKQKYFQYSDDLYQVYADEYKGAFLSELNNIYVALTRAQKELYIFIPRKSGAAFNLVNLLIPETMAKLGRQVDYAKRKAEDSEIMRIPTSPYYDWIQFLKNEFLIGDAVLFRGERKRGEIIHFMLSTIGNLLEQKKDEALAQALAKARCQFPTIEDWKNFSGVVERIISTKDLQDFFEVKEGELFTEREIVNSQGHPKRIDRLIIKRSEVWVIDYKSRSDDAGRQQIQLKEYMQLVGELYPQHQVKGWLVYLDELTKVEIN